MACRLPANRPQLPARIDQRKLRLVISGASCALLLFACVLPASAQIGRSLAGTERVSRHAPQDAAKDLDGFVWLGPGDRSAPYSVSIVPAAQAPGEPQAAGVADSCRKACEKTRGCHAYRKAIEQDFLAPGKAQDVCLLKIGAAVTANLDESITEKNFGPAAAIEASLELLHETDVPVSPEFAKLSDDEREGLAGVMLAVFGEKVCRQVQGSFVSAERMRNGACLEPGAAKPPAGEAAEGAVSEKAPPYSVTLTAADSIVLVASTPKRPGLVGFYFDGTLVHAQAGGAATVASPSLGTPSEILNRLVEENAKRHPPRPR